MRTLLALFSGLLATAQTVLWWRAIAWYPSIPDRFPIHFDASGSPDNWATKSAGAWFALPALATVLSLGLVIFAALAVPRLARLSPSMINVPNKARFLSLSPESRVQALSPVVCFLIYLATITTGLFIAILEAIARATPVQQGPTLLWPTAFMILSIGGVLVMIWALGRRLESTPATAS